MQKTVFLFNCDSDNSVDGMIQNNFDMTCVEVHRICISQSKVQSKAEEHFIEGKVTLYFAVM